MMRAPLRVLIVEDWEQDALLMVHELQRGGYEPVWERVDDVSKLGAALQRERWEIVLADYNLPGLDALEVLEIVRKSDGDVPFLIVSGSVGEETAVQAMQAGARDYIMKSNLSRLVPAVRRELLEAAGRAARRQAEQALRESEERYRLLVEHTSDIITMTSTDGTILFESPSIELTLGFRPEELVGKNLLDTIHPEDRASASEHFQRLGDGDAGRAEFRVLHRDGSWRTLEIISTLRTIHRGENVILATSRDITERRALEGQLRHSQKMEAIGRLAGGVAHDFNNLLTAILGYCELLGEQIGGRASAREALAEIQRAAERAAGLTGQLLAFSRRQVLTPRVIDLDDIVRNMQGMLRPLIGEDVDLVTIPAGNLGHVRADPAQLEQVIANLVVNARDAMPRGGRLTIETANVDIQEPFARQHIDMPPGPYVMLAVSDTGEGMDEATRSHLFEPFFTTKEVGKGTGLGLSTVYGVIKQSGGHIWVYSEPGDGTTFKVYLPRVGEPVDRQMSAPAVELPPGTETVLLVEDEEMVRHLTNRILTRKGYQVLQASRPEEAIALVERHPGPIHLLVTDVVMPGLGGRELAERVTRMRPQTRVLYISGYTDHGIVHQGVLEPETPYLQKPFTPDALISKVREVLRQPAPA